MVPLNLQQRIRRFLQIRITSRKIVFAGIQTNNVAKNQRTVIFVEPLSSVVIALVGKYCNNRTELITLLIIYHIMKCIHAYNHKDIKVEKIHSIVNTQNLRKLKT